MKCLHIKTGEFVCACLCMLWSVTHPLLLRVSKDSS